MTPEEKREVRRWCLAQALLVQTLATAENQIKYAKKLEQYITGKD